MIGGGSDVTGVANHASSRVGRKAIQAFSELPPRPFVDRRRRRSPTEEAHVKVHLAALIALAAAVTLASAAAGSPNAARQRVTITTQAPKTTKVSPFTLTPVQSGPVKPDVGSWVVTSETSRKMTREGQDVDVYVTTSTLKGKLGSLVVRVRQDWTEAGNGYNASVDTWKVVRGTGQYARVTGGGRGTSVWLESNDHWSSRDQGFLTTS
jgi:hypothetical protein